MENNYISFPHKYLEVQLSACRDLGIDGTIYDTSYNMIDVFDSETINNHSKTISHDRYLYEDNTIENNMINCLKEIMDHNILKPGIIYELDFGESQYGNGRCSLNVYPNNIIKLKIHDEDGYYETILDKNTFREE